MLTNTVGDPTRGERIADAVLDDDEARAEITAPITDAVLATTGLPPDRAPAVEAVVDRILQDPSGARAFIDPFAGSWARLLGEDDSRPAEFDLAPVLDDVDALLVPLGIETELDGTSGDLEVPSVPLPRTELTWMDGVRGAVAGSVIPLALIAAGLATAAFLTGERRRVLRAVGIWAVLAGAVWIVLPPLAVRAARSWATGADAVIATSLDEATADMRTAALVLLTVGASLVVGSVVVPPTLVDRTTPRIRTRPSPSRAPEPATTRATTLPPHDPVRPPAGRSGERLEPTRPVPVHAGAEPPRPSSTAGARPPAAPPDGDEPDVDSESVWDFYR